LDFRLRVEGAAPGLDLRGVVRRVEPRGRRGRVAIAVQLDPAAPPVRQAFRATLLSRTAPATRMR
jgi:hypothetical protein